MASQQPVFDVVISGSGSVGTEVWINLGLIPNSQQFLLGYATYIAEDKDKDQIVVGIGQNEKLNASSPRIKLITKLCTIIAVEILSPILIDQRTCNINGKLTKNTAIPFQIKSKLKA